MSLNETKYVIRLKWNRHINERCLSNYRWATTFRTV